VIVWTLGAPPALVIALGVALSACKSEKRAPKPTPLFPLEFERATRVGAAVDAVNRSSECSGGEPWSIRRHSVTTNVYGFVT